MMIRVDTKPWIWEHRYTHYCNIPFRQTQTYTEPPQRSIHNGCNNGHMQTYNKKTGNKNISAAYMRVYVCILYILHNMNAMLIMLIYTSSKEV